jgi:hypothetical protein
MMWRYGRSTGFAKGHGTIESKSCSYPNMSREIVSEESVRYIDQLFRPAILCADMFEDIEVHESKQRHGLDTVFSP